MRAHWSHIRPPGGKLDRKGFIWTGKLCCSLNVSLQLMLISLRSKYTFHRAQRHPADSHKHTTTPASVSRTFHAILLTNFITNMWLCCFYGHSPLFLIPATYSIPRRRQWHPTPALLPGKSHGRRNLVGCSPWGTKGRTRLSDFPFTFHFHALENEMATHSSVLAWRIPGTEEPGGLPSMGSHRVRHD